jgi:hypothetical protein
LELRFDDIKRTGDNTRGYASAGSAERCYVKVGYLGGKDLEAGFEIGAWYSRHIGGIVDMD